MEMEATEKNTKTSTVFLKKGKYLEKKVFNKPI